MHNGEFIIKYQVLVTFNTKRMSNKTRFDVLVKQRFRTWMITLLHYEFG